jgi:hypothetical protein
MDLHEVQSHLNEWLQEAAVTFQKVPGSAVLIRYVRSSYQNDPVRSAIELVLFIFFIRYLLAPSYSTSKQNFVKLTEDVSCGQMMGGKESADSRIGRKSTSWSRNGPPSPWWLRRLRRRRLTWRSCP